MAEQPLGNEPPNKRAKIDSFQSPDPTGKYIIVNPDQFSTGGEKLGNLSVYGWR